MLEVDTCAPDFELPDETGNPVRLSEQLKHGSVLVYFYPADFTPVCTREACTFRDFHPQLVQLGAQVIGISPQDCATHALFRKKYDLPFTLLADPEKRVIRAYGCVGPLGIGVKRVSYFIDRNSRILEAVHAMFRVSRHAALVQQILQKP